MNIAFGLSWKGIVIAALLLLPNILFMLLPKRNMPALQNGSLIVTILEQASRIMYFALIILTTGKAAVSNTSPFLYIALGALLIYYLLWARYFASGMDFRHLFDTVLFIPLPMAVFPILFLLSAALWLKSLPSAAAALLFAVGHLINSTTTSRQIG